MTHDMSWDKAKIALETHTCYRKLPPDVRLTAFIDHLHSLKKRVSSMRVHHDSDTDESGAIRDEKCALVHLCMFDLVREVRRRSRSHSRESVNKKIKSF